MAKHVVRPFITSRIPCDSSFHINSAEAYESVIKVKEMADILLPLHFLNPKERYEKV